MVDDDGPDGATVTLTQSLGIAYYVARKSGRFIPEDPVQQVEAWEWCLFGATDLYPPFAYIYLLRWQKDREMSDALDHFSQEMRRYAERLNNHLDSRQWLVGTEYCIADMALYPMCALAWRDFPQLHDLTGINHWMQRVAARPTVTEAMRWFGDKAP